VSETINAAENPELANKLAAEETKETKEKPKAEIVTPQDNVVTLPGGYVTSTGEVFTEAEVRELTGKDEEAIARSSNAGKVLNGILTRGTVRIGDVEATEEVLDQLFIGDRDYLLLSIFQATFGETTETDGYCQGCQEYKSLEIDTTTDIKVENLDDPIGERRFQVKGKQTYDCVIPTGKTQKELLANSDKTMAELTTILLAGTVRSINGSSVINRTQIQSIGLSDRRLIAEEVNKKTFGPIVDQVEAECPDCGGKVVSPISIGGLFRL